MKQRFTILSTGGGIIHDSFFAPLRRKKLFILNEIVCSSVGGIGGAQGKKIDIDQIEHWTLPVIQIDTLSNMEW